MHPDALDLITSILTDSRRMKDDLERLRRLRGEDREVVEMISRVDENTHLLRRIRDTVESEENILELP